MEVEERVHRVYRRSRHNKIATPLVVLLEEGDLRLTVGVEEDLLVGRLIFHRFTTTTVAVAAAAVVVVVSTMTAAVDLTTNVVEAPTTIAAAVVLVGQTILTGMDGATMVLRDEEE